MPTIFLTAKKTPIPLFLFQYFEWTLIALISISFQLLSNIIIIIFLYKGIIINEVLNSFYLCWTESLSVLLSHSNYKRIRLLLNRHFAILKNKNGWSLQQIDCLIRNKIRKNFWDGQNFKLQNGGNSNCEKPLNW